MDDIFIPYRKYQFISARLDHVFGKRLKEVEIIISNHLHKFNREPKVDDIVYAVSDYKKYKIKQIVPVYDEEVNTHYIVVENIT